jgi:hypothetical protein
MSHEPSEHMFPHPNIHNSSTRSHPSEEENRTRNRSKNCKCKLIRLYVLIPFQYFTKRFSFNTQRMKLSRFPRLTFRQREQMVSPLQGFNGNSPGGQLLHILHESVDIWWNWFGLRQPHWLSTVPLHFLMRPMVGWQWPCLQ